MSGLTPAKLQRVRGRLVEFAEEMFEPMARKDQRRWGEAYLCRLMLDGKRKSIEPMAARLQDGDEECLQQFVNQSPWRPEPVRRRLAARMDAEICPQAWVIDDTGFPSSETTRSAWRASTAAPWARSAIARSGSRSRRLPRRPPVRSTGGCSCPPSGTGTHGGRPAGVPEGVVHEPKWKLALQMINELREWGLEPPVVLGDAAYGDITELRAGLAEREVGYVLDVKGSTSALPESARPQRPQGSGKGRPPTARYRRPFDSLAGLALAGRLESQKSVGSSLPDGPPKSARKAAPASPPSPSCAGVSSRTTAS
ncbi:MAG TPA: transposase [Solirubrobacterales bacterium]|nr:transposase [Solirubrobacterales bacterium]